MMDTLLMFESPVQIMVVLVIALVVFGPKRLPEIGKQLGGALRELKKAGNEVVSTFSHDDSAEHSSSYPYTSPDYNAVPQNAYASVSTPDLTDYTIVRKNAATVPTTESHTSVSVETASPTAHDPLDVYAINGAKKIPPADGASA